MADLALADQRRWGGFRLQQPAHADLDVVGRHVGKGVEGARSTAGYATPGRAAQHFRGPGVTHIEVSVGELELEVRRDGVGDTRVRGPGEAPGVFIAVGEAEGGDAKTISVDAHVRQCSGLVIGPANAGADERRQALPGSEVDIGIREADKRTVIAVVHVESPAEHRVWEIEIAANR